MVTVIIVLGLSGLLLIVDRAVIAFGSSSLLIIVGTIIIIGSIGLLIILDTALIAFVPSSLLIMIDTAIIALGPNSHVVVLCLLQTVNIF